MIPYALLQCTIDHKDVRIIDLSVFHFLFRVPEKIEDIHFISLSFYNGEEYDNISIQTYSFSLEEKAEFYYVYRIETEDENFAQHVRKLMEMVNRYTQFKLEDQQEKWINYPLELDTIFPDSKEELLKELFNQKECNFPISKFEWGICLENPILIHSFLEMDWDGFMQKYVSLLPISKVPVQYVYIGNQFCSHLFPKLETLNKVLEKCQRLELKPVLMFAPLKEHEIKERKEILKDLDSSIEIVANDLGMLEMLKEYSFPVIEGILLNKHVKDTRLKYVEHFHAQPSDYKTRYRKSYESCGQTMNLSPSCDFYFPKFQMNTSGTCTMYAKCKNGNRGYQEEILDCPKYCLNQHFLYPTHLRMIGEYNSLFGYDVEIFSSSRYRDFLLAQPIKRMIITL